jgi:acyl-CoA reductase-like NAD-dependent aldehyde dehydrogenase
LRWVREVRRQIVERAAQLIDSVEFPSRRGPLETLSAEILPLADACRFLEQTAAKTLAPRRLSRRGRPLWLQRVSVELQRDPFGVVLIVGAANYPLLLMGVHALQGLVAGNAVVLKPGRGATPATRALVQVMTAAGLDPALVPILPEEPSSVEAAVRAGVHKVVLTGSADTGRRVQTLLADTLTPATMELSGCDAVFVLDGADLNRVARCLAFGLRLNGSATCIAPRRVFVAPRLVQELTQLLQAELMKPENDLAVPVTPATARLLNEALDAGATVVAGGLTGGDDAPVLTPTVLSGASPEMPLLQSDVFAPITSLVAVPSSQAALKANDQCPYALGAAVFGEDALAADFAKQIDAGCIVINDLIAPTADPRAPFGGRKQSGFGVTRGSAGLEDMTQLKTVIHQRAKWLPHLDSPTPYDQELLTGLLQMTHGRGWRAKLAGLGAMARAARRQYSWKQQITKKEEDDDA